jgi:hemoglobin
MKLMPVNRDYVAEAIELGVDEAMIEALVRRFYEAVRRDAVIGPVFESRIAEWEPHLQRMCAFWASVMLRAGGYHGQPMPMHAPLPVEAAHFERWLALFSATAHDTCGDAADLFIERARRIAQSLELGIATWRGLLLAPGERLPPMQGREQGALSVETTTI